MELLTIFEKNIFMKKLLPIIIFLLFLKIGNAQHPPWYFVNTNKNHIILFHSSAIITIDNVQIEPGDFIAAFYYDEFNNLKCGTGVGMTGDIGGLMYTGETSAATCWGSEDNVFNGFQLNEEFKWKIWRSSDGSVLDATQMEYDTQSWNIPDSNLYVTDGISSLLMMRAETIPGIDMSVNSLLSPQTGCTLSETEEITILIENHHTEVATNFNISYSITKNDTLMISDTEFFTDTIPVNSTYEYTFQQTVDFSDSAVYVVSNLVEIPGDVNFTNDDNHKEILSLGLLFVDLGEDNQICETGGINIYPTDNYTEYLWSDGSTTESIYVNTQGTYSLTATDQYGCLGSGSVYVSVVSNPYFNLADEVFFCEGNNYTLDAGGSFNYYYWNTGSSNSYLNLVQGGTFSVTVTDENGCKSSDTIIVTQVLIPEINLGNDTSLVALNNYILNIDEPYDSYLWNTGSTNSAIEISEFGEYFVVINDHGCFASDTINFTKDEKLSFIIDYKNENLTIYIPEYSNGDLSIFNYLGQEVLSYPQLVDNVLPISIRPFRQGIYYLRISVDGIQTVKAFFFN